MSGWDGDFEILPDTTADEHDKGRGDDDESNDERLRADRPPHWDRPS